ncbi:unnamed protein product [Ectocarpus sp. CCAP 1310/34]|nr:unnamed protein product [Ectocarpus sp. CCAP 1310/34]
MTDDSPGDNTPNLAKTVRGLKRHDGRNPAEFEGWMKRRCVVLGVTRRDVLPLLKGRSRPAETNEDYVHCKSNEDLFPILYLLVEVVGPFGTEARGRTRDHGRRSGSLQGTELEVQETMEELINAPMEPGQNPDVYFNQRHLVRYKAEKLGETISYRYFKDMCVTGLTDEFKDVKMIMYRDPDFNVDKMQTTVSDVFLDEQSRKGPKWTAEKRDSSGGTAPKRKAREETQPAGVAKWCSVYFATRNSDEECFEHGATQPKKSSNTGKAFSACANCAHCSSSSNKRNQEEIKPNAAGATLLIDTGASEKVLNDRFIPGLKETVWEYKNLAKPMAVSVGGDHEVDGIATGLIRCIVKDSNGDSDCEKQAALQRGLVVPGLGRNVFSPTAQIQNGVKLAIEGDHPHLATTRETTAPMQMVYTDSMGKITLLAKRSFGYASKFTDAHSWINEIYLLKAKSETFRAFHAYNMQVAAPLGRRMEIIRGDRGEEYVGDEFTTRERDLTETPAYSMPPDVLDDDNFYESDVLNVTPVLGKVSTTGDEFNGSSALDTVDLETENQLLRQQIRRMCYSNLIGEGLQQQTINTGHDTSPSPPNSPRLATFSDDPDVPQAESIAPGSASKPTQGIWRPLKVTRAATTRRPNASDSIDPSLEPSSLKITMDDSGIGCVTATTMRPDPSALTSGQLLDFASKAYHDRASAAPDFAHLDEESLPVSRASVYDTGTPIPQASLEEERIKIPNTYKEAVNSLQASQRNAAIAKEMDSLTNHKVKMLVPITSVPKEEEILRTRFVFKQKADGKLKITLVVQGHVDESDIDFGGSYAPDCSIRSVRTLLAIACEHGWPDPVNGEIMVYELKHSREWLSQSPVLWFNTIGDVLTVIGFKPTQSDPFVFVYGSGDTLVILTLCIDDILISGKDPELACNTRRYEEGTLIVSHNNYIKTILERFGKEHCNPVSTPGRGPGLSTDQPADELLGAADTKLYQSVTGSLLYLAHCTRYDLCDAVNQLTRASSKPAQVHITAARHALRYFFGTPDMLVVFNQGQFRIAAFADASFAAKPDNSKSTTGYLFVLEGGLISFGTKTQSLTTQ